MEPQIRYARTDDGVSIACYAFGTGPALVFAQLPNSHLQAELRDPGVVEIYEAIARFGTLVRYDHRGFGMSDRTAPNFSLDALVSDLEAVVEYLKLDRFVLFAAGDSSPMALRYTATNQGHVTHLVLFPGFARAEGISWKRLQSLAVEAEDDWDYVSEAVPRAQIGWENEEYTRPGAELLRQAVTPAAFARYVRGAMSWDASAFVPDVNAPTLLMLQTDAHGTLMDAARRILSELPNGRLVMVEGETVPESRQRTFAAVMKFLGGGRTPDVSASQPREPSSTAIILFADVVESTAITARIGNEAFRERSRQLDDALRAVIRNAGGSPVEGRTLGDGVLGLFTSAAQAIAAALQCEQHAERVGLQLHLGIHAGDVIRESGGGVSGLAVSIASRISDLTRPNEILVSSTVRDLARASTDVRFEDRGEHALKGIAELQRVFAVLTDQGS